MRQDEREFGELGRLELERAEINPAPRAPTVRRADAGNQHRDQRAES